MSTRPNIITRKQELPLKDDSSTLFLKVMISIAVFLFAVTLAGVLSINSMLLNWNQSILGSLTVQIMPVNNINKEKAQEETPLQDEQLEQLIKPWLGDGVNIKDLPVPRLIDVRLKKNAEVDFIELAEKLAEVSPQASLDNHKLWLNKLIKFADGLKMMALSVLLLVVVVTSGAIFYSTKTSLGLHQHIIEILHLMGAKDAYVAQQYARRTAQLGFVGGVIGLIFAIPSIFAISRLAEQIEGGIISDATLSVQAWGAILSLPVFASLIAMITAYYTVKRTLEKMM